MDRGRVGRFPRSAASPVNKKVNVFFSSGLYKNSRCNRGVTYKKIFINYVFSSMARSCGAHSIKTAIAADSSPVPTAHSTVTSRTRVPGPTFCCLGGGPVSSPALMASRFRVPSTACGFGAYSRSVDPNLPLLGTGSQFDTLSAGLRSNLSVPGRGREGPESLRVFGCLPNAGARGCTEAGVRKALTEPEVHPAACCSALSREANCDI